VTTTFDRSVLRNPRWILAIIVGAIIAIALVRLGVWQLDRLAERRTSNALIEARSAETPVPLAELVGRIGMDPEALAYRPAIVEGRYRADLELFSVGRTYGDVSGTLVVTPLEIDDGTLIMAVRGLVPTDTAGPPAVGYEPPTGRVTVVGRLDDGEEPLRIGEPDPPGGVVRSISRIDLDYLDRWIDAEVLPIDVVLESQDPPDTAASPTPVPPDELSEGPHLGYAIQWFAFAVIVVVGVGYLVWRAGTTTDERTVTGTTTPP
jgi:cytochrome oxidase assembly protein ShyY1